MLRESITQELSRRRSLTVPDLKVLAFAFKHNEEMHQIPQALEKSPIEALLSYRDLGECLVDECLHLCMVEDVSAFATLIEKQPGDLVKSLVTASVPDSERTKRKILCLRQEAKAVELALISLTGIEDTAIPLTGIATVEHLAERALQINPVDT